MTLGVALLATLFVLLDDRARKGSLAAGTLIVAAGVACLAVVGGVFYVFYQHGSAPLMGFTIVIVVLTSVAHLLVAWLTK